MNDFNLPLLRKAVEWAESEAAKPETESEWYQAKYITSGTQLGRSCGTAYCIAGWVAHQENASTHFGVMAPVAQRLLGVDSDDIWGHCDEESGIYHVGLFNAENTIEDVREIAERIARKYGEEL